MRDISKAGGLNAMESLSVVSARDRERLRHPLERVIATVVAVVDVILIVLVLALLMWGADWLAARPSIGKYKSHVKILLIAVLGAPLVVTYATRRSRLLVQEESIRVTPTQLPEIHRVLVSQCTRMGLALPELYVSDGVDASTSFSCNGRHYIILSAHDFAMFPDAFDDVLQFMIAREIGSICLGHTSFRNELLQSLVAPIPFLKVPLRQIRTYSRDRYGAFLAPRAIRALIVAAAGDRLRNRVDLDAYFAQLDEGSDQGFWTSVVWLMSKRVPLGHRVQELRRAGLLTKC